VDDAIQKKTFLLFEKKKKEKSKNRLEKKTLKKKTLGTATSVRYLSR
jgi:hypothetical protein